MSNESGWTERLARLNDLLAELYPDHDMARQTVRRAGLPAGAIRFHPAAGLNWFNILEEAQRRNRVEAIVRVAQADFPDRTEWTELADGVTVPAADSVVARSEPATGGRRQSAFPNEVRGGVAEHPSAKGHTVRRRLATAGVGSAAVAGVVALWVLRPASIPERLLEARKPNVTRPQFIKPQDEARTPSTPGATLLLFVHGIFGDTVGSWSGSDRSRSLASLALSRKEFSLGYDAFAFGYPSTMVKQGSFHIPQAATAFATEIRFRRFLDKYSRIVMVTHSMGGLVALETLTTNPDIRARVPLVVSFATPYDGAQVATLGDRVLQNPALSNMIPRDANNSFLSSLGYRWKRSQNTNGPITRVVCAYESVPLPGIGLVVPETSASSLCDDVADPIAEDHIGIVKPDGDEHQSLKVLTNALRTLPALTLAAVPPNAGPGKTRQSDPAEAARRRRSDSGDTQSPAPAQTQPAVSPALVPGTWRGTLTFYATMTPISIRFDDDFSMALTSPRGTVASGTWSRRSNNTVSVDARHQQLGAFGCELKTSSDSITGRCTASGAYAGDIALSERGPLNP